MSLYVVMEWVLYGTYGYPWPKTCSHSMDDVSLYSFRRTQTMCSSLFPPHCRILLIVLGDNIVIPCFTNAAKQSAIAPVSDVERMRVLAASEILSMHTGPF